MSIRNIARVVHEANRAQQQINEEPVSPPWDEAPEWMAESAIDGVLNALNGATPEESHQNWLIQREADGWVYGDVKDEAKKTHPCMLPYEDLPEEQRRKDRVFVAVARAMADLETPLEGGPFTFEYAVRWPDDTIERVASREVADHIVMGNDNTTFALVVYRTHRSRGDGRESTSPWLPVVTQVGGRV